jgi:hypothetical protein
MTDLNLDEVVDSLFNSEEEIRYQRRFEADKKNANIKHSEYSKFKPINNLLGLDTYKRDIDYFGDTKFDEEYIKLFNIQDIHGKRMGTHFQNLSPIEKKRYLEEKPRQVEEDTTPFPGDFI